MKRTLSSVTCYILNFMFGFLVNACTRRPSLDTIIQTVLTGIALAIVVALRMGAFRHQEDE